MGKKKKLQCIEIENKSYGKGLQGVKVYYEGDRPAKLKDDGTFSMGKNLLEILKQNFSDFKLIITTDETNIKKVQKCFEVRVSQKFLNKIYSASINSYKDLKEDIICNELACYMPDGTNVQKKKFVPGKVSSILSEEIIESLNQADRKAIDFFIPKYLAKNGETLLPLIKAKTQITTLKKISCEIKKHLSSSKTESWWQKYISENILLIQQGYIFCIEKLNVAIGDTKYPDFILITHDSFLEILEIKKPQTNLLKFDNGRNNYYWDTEISKAICQVENYIDLITRDADRIRNYIRDNYGIDIHVVKPRAIILAGNSTQLTTKKSKEDYRLLSQSNKNISFLTYDELSSRLDNYIKVLENRSADKNEKK